MPEKESHEEQLLTALREQNILIRRWIKDNNNFGLILVRGMIIGLGSAIGATVILSLMIWLLQPMKLIKPIEPFVGRVERLLDNLERKRTIDRSTEGAQQKSLEELKQVPESPGQ